MVTITKIKDSAGARSYFEKDDYYTKDKSGDKAWMGKGSESLGLTEVTPEGFQAILEGKDLEGNALVQAASNGVHRLGWDVTFSPSKSISVAWAFGNEEQTVRILAAHDAAVTSTMKYLEDNLVEARITVNNKTSRVTTGNIVAARFDHYTTREVDPELHSHVVVANVTQCPDGTYRAVDNDKIFAREFMIAAYENEFAAELKQRDFSVSMTKYDTGNSHYATIEGIDEKIIEQYSKRSDQIDKAIEPLKEYYPNASREELRQIACLGTRQLKQTLDREVLHVSWNQQLIDLGYTRKGLSASIQKAYEQSKATQVNIKPDEKEIVKTACTILNENESTFSREDVIKTAARISGGDYRISDLERAFHELKGSTIVTLDKNAGVYTTKEMKKIERNILNAVKEGRDTVPAILTSEEIRARTKELYDTFTDDQKMALEHITTAKDRIIGIQGDAGTGKTTLLRAGREQFESKGFTVRGLSFTGKAVKELEAGAGIESKTLHSFLPQIQSNLIELSEKEAWFVDEVSMVGSKQMSDLIKASKKAHARLVFIGDTKQLQSIDAGRTFQKLQETGAMKTVHMKEIVRQKDEAYKAIVKDVSEKKIDSSFEKMITKKKIKEIAHEQERQDAIVKKVTSKKDHRNVLVVTPLNKDRVELNKQIRNKLKEKEILKGPEHNFSVRSPRTLGATEKHFADSYSIGDFVSTNGNIKGVKIGTEGHVLSFDNKEQNITILTSRGKKININVAQDSDKIKAFQEKPVCFMQGDKVVFLKNDRPLKVQNGLTAEIKRIDERGNVTVITDSKKEISFNINHSYNYLDHGYAVTDYKSQGQTTKEVIFHANTDKTNSYNSFYEAITRGKENVHVYTNDTGKLKEQVKKEVKKTSTLDHDKPQIQRIIPQIQQIRIAPKEINIPIGREGR
jgi:conjugative relaxase-like TrwC/TraI family protein